MVTTVAGMRKRRCGGIFRRGAVRPDGAVGYRRVPVSLALFHVPYPEPALACSGKRNVFVKPSAEPNLFRLCRGGKTTVENKRTISLSRVQSSLLELPRREMEHENEGIIEAFRGGRRRPRLFVGAGPFTSPECRPDRASDFGNDGLSSLKGLYFFSVRSGSIDCISCD